MADITCSLLAGPTVSFAPDRFEWAQQGPGSDQIVVKFGHRPDPDIVVGIRGTDGLGLLRELKNVLEENGVPCRLENAGTELELKDTLKCVVRRGGFRSNATQFEWARITPGGKLKVKFQTWKEMEVDGVVGPDGIGSSIDVLQRALEECGVRCQLAENGIGAILERIPQINFVGSDGTQWNVEAHEFISASEVSGGFEVTFGDQIVLVSNVIGEKGQRVPITFDVLNNELTKRGVLGQRTRDTFWNLNRGGPSIFPEDVKAILGLV